MSAKKGMRDFPVTLQAGVEHPIDVYGDFFQVITATSSLQLKFNDGTYITREQGMGGPPGEFSRVTLKSTIGQTVIVCLGYAMETAPYDSRTVVTGTVAAVDAVANQAPGVADVLCNAGAGATIVAAVATRRGVWVTIPLEDAAGAVIATTKGVRVAEDAAAGKGSLMYPGDTRFFPGTHELKAWNETASNINIAATEQRRV